MKNFTRSLMAFLCLLILLSSKSISAQSATAPFTHQGITASTGDFLGFLQYKPADYDQHPAEKYPIIIFLHGIGERGNGTTDLDKVAYVGMPRIIYKGNPMRFTWNGKTETFLVLAPQCPMKYGMWPSAFVNDLIAYARQNLRIDTNRIYLTGLSMGAGGSFRYLSDALPDNASHIAAMAAIASPCTFRTGEYIKKANLPVWAFHADDDPTALSKCTKNAIAGINAWNPDVKPLFDLWPTGGHIVWDRVYTDTNYAYQGVVNIYEWFLGQNKMYAVNKLPVSNAGTDTTIIGNNIKLNASGSYDTDGKLVRYVWKKLSGPACGTIATPMSTNSFTVVTGITIPGKYCFELAAVDDRAAFTRDTVMITVTSVAAASPVPVPPVKDTTPSIPPKDTILPVPPIDTAGAPVRDSVSTAPSTDTVSSKPVRDTIPAIPVPAPLPVPASRPVARAGNDIELTTAWTKTLVNGTLSTDSAAWFVKVRWRKISGPQRWTILDSTSIKTYVSNLDTGVYTFRLTVTDNKGASSYDDLRITVKAPPRKVIVPNIIPVADAGRDDTATVGWNKKMLNCSLSKDKDGWLTSVKWTKVSGPASFRILDSSSVVTYATELVEGVYIFRVKVKDNRGDSATDDVRITVLKRMPAPVVSSAAVLAYDRKLPASITDEEKVTLSPNPAISTLRLQYASSKTGQTQLLIYDINGRVVKSTTAIKSELLLVQNINIGDLTKGVYIVVAHTGEKIYDPVKFVKN